MSFWDFIPKILPTVLKAGATIYGAKQSADASNQAASQAIDASNKATAAELEGLREAQRNLEINRTAASPGLLATQEIIGRGARLTPEQELLVQDSRDQALSSLRGSSLRGSARATSAVVSDVDKRVRGGFTTQNQNRADTASRALAGQYFGAGSQVADTAAQQGRAASRGLIDTGNVQSATTFGQGKIRGQAIGDVGAVIADAIKENMGKERDSSFKRVE